MKIKKSKGTIFLLIILSVLIIIPFFFNRIYMDSSELRTKTVDLGVAKRTDYIDVFGNITYVADKGYASVLKTYNNGHVVLEQYLDEKGRTIKLPLGYCIIRREYNENGQNTVISYFDGDYVPVIIKYGYDSIHRSYYQPGQSDTDTYYANGVQVEQSGGYWQYKRIYENGKLIEIRYLDREGALSSGTTFGYALIRRYYTETGKEDYYFDSTEQPVSSSLDQFGVREEEGTITYLNADGNPMNTNRGYAIIKKEGNKTLFYTEEGLPYSIGHNQYGWEIVNGEKVYLDENGKAIVRLDVLLNTNQTLVVCVALILTLVAVAANGKAKAVFISVYIICIVYMTMCNRSPSERRGEFTVFWSYRQMLSNPSLGLTVINNIWLFIPLGAALYDRKHRCRWLICILISICIETIQFFTGIGLAEFDDVISNGLGGLIGCGVSKNILCWWKPRRKRIVENAAMQGGN